VSGTFRYVPIEDVERMIADGWEALCMASSWSILMRWAGEGEPS
jgi:hypothetical protein